MRPEQRYEDETDHAVAGRAEVENAFPVAVSPFQLEDELNDCHLTEGDGEDGEGREYQLVELGLRIRIRRGGRGREMGANSIVDRDGEEGR